MTSFLLNYYHTFKLSQCLRIWSQEGAVAFITLFVVFFNFSRPHGALEEKSAG